MLHLVGAPCLRCDVSLLRAYNNMSRIHLRFWLVAIGCIVFSGCQSQSSDVVRIFVCELRAPKALNPDPKTRVSLASWSGESGHFLWAFSQKEQKEEGGYLIFQPDGFVLHPEPESRRALIIQDLPASAQVFRLSLARTPKATDWTHWLRPDCIAKGNVGWSVIYNQKMDVVSTNVPRDCFEMRYKIEMRDLGPGWNPSMKRKPEVSK